MSRGGGAAKEFEGSERRGRLAAAVAQLVLDRFPAGAASDVVKVDIVLVKERDEYGKPKWDSLKKLAIAESIRRVGVVKPARSGEHSALLIRY